MISLNLGINLRKYDSAPIKLLTYVTVLQSNCNHVNLP